MAKSSTSFQPGQSGNPKGRPPKSRALTALLEKGGNRRVQVAGQERAAAKKALFVERVWEGVTTGVITFPDRKIELGANDFIALAKLLLNQIDGPPPAAVDVTSDGQPVGIQIVEVVKQRAADADE